MTITIEPEPEAKLRAMAEREGQEVDALANALLTRVLEQEAAERDWNVAAIQEGLDAALAGREKPLEQYFAEQRVKHGFPDSWPSSAGVTEVAPGVIVVASE
jgi:predicted transcriptional regulator